MLIDGAETGLVPADDRGLAYGDGLFETMRLEAGRVPLLALHLDRLRDGCDRLALACPSPGLLRSEIEEVRAGRTEGVVKIILTRGSGGRGYAPPAVARPRRIVTWHPLPDGAEGRAREGIRVWCCRTILGRNPALAGLKHLARLEQVRASMEPAPPGCAEGLMGDRDGHLIEGIRSNLFVVRGGRLETPALDECGVTGVMRRAVLEDAAADGIETRETRLRIDDLPAAEELFLTSSIFGIWPIVGLVEPRSEWPIGPLTRGLMTRIAARGVPGWAG